MSDVRDLIIVGSGPAGYTAALYAARANLAPLVLKGLDAGGQLMLTTDVENYPGFRGRDPGSRTDGSVGEAGCAFRRRDPARARHPGRPGERPFGVWAGDQEWRARTLIVATGASARWLGVPGEDKLRGRGVSACATCDGFFFRDRELIVVGGGDTAMEEAMFLTKFASSVQIVHRRDAFRASPIMAQRALSNPKINVIWNAVVEEILGEDSVTGVRLNDTVTAERREVRTDGVFMGIGHDPNTSLFAGQLDLDRDGYVIVEEPGTATSVHGVFAAGDVADTTYKQAVTAAGMGCKAAMDAERLLEEERHESVDAGNHSKSGAV